MPGPGPGDWDMLRRADGGAVPARERIACESEAAPERGLLTLVRVGGYSGEGRIMGLSYPCPCPPCPCPCPCPCRMTGGRNEGESTDAAEGMGADDAIDVDLETDTDTDTDTGRGSGPGERVNDPERTRDGREGVNGSEKSPER